MESVRHKLIRGIQGDEIDGFQGIQNALHRLDEAGEGYLDAHIFMKKFIQRLKCPLTRPEREFLLEQLRALSTEQEGDVLDYEQVTPHSKHQVLIYKLNCNIMLSQLGRICNLNSDDSLSESDMEQEPVKPPSPSKTLQLGSAFLASEKRLSEFLRGPLSVGIASTAAVDTPRCLFTGAEKFLEIAESLDQETTGLLPEQGKFYLSGLSKTWYAQPRCWTHVEFPRILAKCGECLWISQSKNAPPATPSPSKASQVSQPNVPDPVVDTTDMSVGDYLMFHATAQEQRNFESLMEVLQNFQKTMQGGAQSAINPVANGVMMSLGQNLRVKVQFSTDA
ncbi:unnamed protein product [Phytophthora lilii]|uniref:Unnamed protein product n=1 Tax=Phytophthora lilii TaxID=2077276 RepID=A0A9W6WV69_9STRA|nr:unnamed protein product [Phytophthora lilii]